jgi:DNA-binding response OmpR family regulator
MMPNSGEHILLVESDPNIIDLVARQTLQAQGYNVDVANNAVQALRLAILNPPDLIITNLNLPDLSGKDLLVALTSQGINAPIILVAERGSESDLVQAFRLGATDYLLWPARDAEIAATVERGLKIVRERRARQRLDKQLQLANQELQRKVRELTTILGIGKAVVSITDQRILFDRIVEGAVQVSDADMGWLLLRRERIKNFLLVSQRNLPEALARKMDQPLDDGVSSLVALSGETLTIHGEPLKRFNVSRLGLAVAVVPIKVNQEVVGLLLVVRKAPKPFERTEQTLLEAVADYASISLVNARLFQALERSAQQAKDGERTHMEQLEKLREQVGKGLVDVLHPLDQLLQVEDGHLEEKQRIVLENIQSELRRLSQAAEIINQLDVQSKQV